MGSQFLNQLIVALCVNFNSDPSLVQYYTSCTQALTAASIQTDVRAKVDKTSRFLEDKAAKTVTQLTGEKVWIAAGFIYTGYVKQAVIMTFPVKPIVDNVNISANMNTQNVTLSWSF